MKICGHTGIVWASGNLECVPGFLQQQLAERSKTQPPPTAQPSPAAAYAHMHNEVLCRLLQRH